MMVSAEGIAFLLLSVGTIGGAIMLLFFSKIVHALLSAVVTFVSLAGLYVLLSAEFLAGAQILIYSGAVTILFLFAVMLTKKDDRASGTRFGWGILVFLTVFALGFFIYNGIHDMVGEAEEVPIYEDNADQIGTTLFTKYIIPFELVSVLLLVALIGSVVLAKRRQEEGQRVGTKEGE